MLTSHGKSHMQSNTFCSMYFDVLIVNASRIPPGPGMWQEAGNTIEGVYVEVKVYDEKTGGTLPVTPSSSAAEVKLAEMNT